MTTITPWRPWLVCAVLLMATALSYLDRQALSVVAPLVREELKLDNAQLGLLLSAFFYSYAAMHLFVGAILDRFNIRYVYGAFVAAWSLAQACTGLARTFAALFAGRMALGIFEAAAQPGAARIIARLVPAKDRTLANGIMMSGGSIGAMVAPLVMIALASAVGWRAGFLLLGGIGLLWAFFWVLWFRPPAEVLKGHPTGITQAEGDRWGAILRDPRFWACVAGATFGIPILHISSSWVPTFFVQEWKLPLTAGLGVYLFLVYLGLDLGFVGGGAAVSLLARRGWRVGRARKAVLVVSTACMLCACAVPWAPSVPSAVVLVFLLNLGRASYGANFLAFNQDLAPGRVGTIAGLMGAIGAFSGALLVWAVGVLSKASGFKFPFLIVGLLAVLGVIPLLAVDWDRPLSEKRGISCAK
jgi:ACS family hexuronate transporter-like MFS transporter